MPKAYYDGLQLAFPPALLVSTEQSEGVLWTFVADRREFPYVTLYPNYINMITGERQDNSLMIMRQHGIIE
jgi:hypothetical protein